MLCTEQKLLEESAYDEAELEKLSPQELLFLDWAVHWHSKRARVKQLAPPGEWTNWGILSGRGFGKTELGARWLLEQAGQAPGSYNGIIAPTLDDVRFTCIEGLSGILGPEVGFPQSLIDDYNITAYRVILWNGALLRGFSSEKPRKLRGPQHENVWGDEVAAWENAIETLDMMKFGLRIGKHPKFCWTTTPKPNKIVKRLMAAPNTIVTTGSSYENKDNLAAAFWTEISQYEGTKLGRQELDGEILDAEEDGIIENSWIRRYPWNKPLPRFLMIVATLDTAYTERDRHKDSSDAKSKEPDPTAMQVWGLFMIGVEYHVILLDAWQDWFKFPDLVKTVQDELKKTYGDADEPLMKPHIPGATAGHQGRPIDLTIIEDKSSGISLRQSLAAENIMSVPYNPGRADKLLRLHLVSPLFAAGRVWMVEGRPADQQSEVDYNRCRAQGKAWQVRNWAEPVREALCTFRGEGSIEHDDHVDAATQALKYFKDNFFQGLTTPRGGKAPEAPERQHGTAGERAAKSNPYAQ